MKQYNTMTDEKLIAAFRGGESEIMDYIMEKYKFLVLRKAREMFLLGGENEDLIQEGMIGLFKAVVTYDESKESSFRHFAEICISGQLNTAIKLSMRKKHQPLNEYESLYEKPQGMTEGRKLPLIETLESRKSNDPETLFLDKEYLQGIAQKAENNLSPLEYKVLYLYTQGCDYQMIARLLDKTPKSIDNALQRIRHKMSTILEKKTK